MKNKIFFLLLACSISPSVFAQSIDISNRGQEPPHPVDLILNISIDQIQNRAPAGLIIQLLSDYLFVSRSTPTDQISQQTDESGTVMFHTLTGSHEIRISGEGIEESSRTIVIMQQQSRDIENIVVKSKSNNAKYGNAQRGSSGVVSASSLNIPEKALKEFRAGSKALENKDYDGAKKHFSSATSIYEKYSLAFNGMGVAQMAAGDATAARASFEKAVEIDDHLAEGYRNLARLSLTAHDFEGMDALLTKSLLSEPLNAWALTYAAYSELQLHNFDAAIVHAHAAHGVPHAGLASVHIVAAHALEATNQSDEALKEYRQYLEEDPKGRDSERAKQSIESLSGAKTK